jgi:hypothetical protein
LIDIVVLVDAHNQSIDAILENRSPSSPQAMNTLNPKRSFISSQSRLSPAAFRPLSVILLAATMLFAGVSYAGAGTIFSDDFTGVAASNGQQSNGLNGAGWYFYNAAPTATAYTVATDNTAPLAGNVLSNGGGTASNSWALKSFAPVSLGSIGDAITLKFDFHIPTSATATAYFSLNAGFYDAPDAIAANAFGSNPLASVSGYYGNQQVKPSAVAATFYEVTESALNNINSTSGTATLGLSTSAHTISLTLERVATGLELTWAVDNTIVGGFIDTTPQTYTFSTVRLSAPGSGSPTFPVNFDNIGVTTSAIPEPSTATLFVGCFVLMFCGVTRKRRC